MAKKKKTTAEEVTQEELPSIDNLKLSKFLIKEFNKGGEKIAYCLATDDDNPTDVKDYISTGSTLLNYLISNKKNGGAPVGKLTEIVGEEASGKSLLCAHMIAETQKKNGLAIYIDTENAANPEFMQRIGVDIDKLVYLQPGCIEEVFESIDKTIAMARAKDVKKPITIIWDSVAGTPPRAELEGDYDPNSRIGLMAKALAKGMRKLTTTVGRERVTLIFTNQLKMKIGVMFGDPMTTPGGKAIPYHASVRLRLTRSTEIKDDNKQTYAIRTLAKVIKSRLGPPLRKCEFDIHFADGIDDEASWFTYLHQVGAIRKAGGWCYMFVKGEEIKFREAEWKKMLRSDSEFKETALELLDNNLVVKYKDKVNDIDIDPESLMDMESLTENE